MPALCKFGGHLTALYSLAWVGNNQAVSLFIAAFRQMRARLKVITSTCLIIINQQGLTMEISKNERRAYPTLSEEQIEAIAERAAEVALEKVYTSIGKSVVSKILWLVGAATLAVTAWLNGAGHLKI